MLDIAFKDFKAKKGRAAMCIIGVMVCVLLIGTVNSVLYSMESGLKGDLGTVNGKLYFEKNGTSYPPFASIITEDLGNKVLNNSKVNPQTSTKALYTYLQGNIAGHPVCVIGLTPGKEQAFIDNTKVTGTSSLVGQSKNAVIIG
jgi:putative ABC transport system permease protein